MSTILFTPPFVKKGMMKVTGLVPTNRAYIIHLAGIENSHLSTLLNKNYPFLRQAFELPVPTKPHLQDSSKITPKGPGTLLKHFKMLSHPTYYLGAMHQN